MEPSKVVAIEKLNKVLENIEYQLLELAREYEQEIKVENPDDYELDLIFEFCAGEEEIASWFKSMKIHLENFRKMELDWGLASGADHNGALDDSLQGQKHCWLLHLLYDDLLVSWEKILKIDWLWADFCLYFQYDFYLSEVKTISEMKERLLEVQKKLLEVGKSIRQRARKRVLSSKSNLFDYRLDLEIVLYDDESRENVLPAEDFKFGDPFSSWIGLCNNTKDKIFRDIEYQLEGLGLDIEKALSFNLLWANLILRYSHRFYLKEL